MKSLTKEDLRDFALAQKEKLGKFPVHSDWELKNGYPCSRTVLNRLFKTYTQFREFCNETPLKRTKNISMKWLQDNCTVDSNNCWNWIKSTTEGYGRVGHNNKVYLTHRLAWELSFGGIPDNLIVRHICDNKRCCNPEHLELGTPQDNTNDFINRKIIIRQTTCNKPPFHKNIEDRIIYYLGQAKYTINNCLELDIIKTNAQGYYQISFNYKIFKLHRLVLSYKLGKEYDQINIARHLCNNKKCINIDHLVEGNKSDNSIDCRSYSKNTKLTIEQVRNIKQDMLGKDFTVHGAKTKFDKFWSENLNVSNDTIFDIRNKRTWTDVSEDIN